MTAETVSPPPEHPDWRFQCVSDGCPIFHDRENDLYHSVVGVEDPTALYQEQFYEEGSAARFSGPVETVVRFFRRQRARYVARYVRPEAGALDLGCGNAYVLYYLREDHKVPTVIGTQLSVPAQKFARDMLKVDVRLGELPDLMPDLPKFSVITAWHVFEHVAEYETYFRLCHELLVSKGHLIIEVPNARSWTVGFSGGGWMGWDPPNHVVHFTPEGLRRILARQGFEALGQTTFSLEYSVFTSLQSICNRFTSVRNAFYDGLRRVGGSRPPLGLVAFQGVAFALLFLPVLLVNLLLAPTDRGEVIHIVARKKT